VEKSSKNAPLGENYTSQAHNLLAGCRNFVQSSCVTCPISDPQYNNVLNENMNFPVGGLACDLLPARRFLRTMC
jgi:hypothetical protein